MAGLIVLVGHGPQKRAEESTKMKFRLTITPKLTLIFVLFAALLLAVVSLLAYTSGSTSLQSAAVSELVVNGHRKTGRPG